MRARALLGGLLCALGVASVLIGLAQPARPLLFLDAGTITLLGLALLITSTLRVPPIVRELARAHIELARRQSFTDALLETIDVGIVSCDADGVFVVNNRAERQIFGLADELAGSDMDRLQPRIRVVDRDGRELDAGTYPLARALRGEDVSRVEVLAGPADGPYRNLVVRARRITGPDGELLGAVAALTDVTAEQAATRALAEEHRRLTEAQRVGRLGSFEHDFRTGAWTFSENLCALWGLDPDQISIDVTRSLVVAEDRPLAEETWRTACRLGGAHTCDYRIRRADDGALRLIRANVEVELDADGRPVGGRGTNLDVTELNAAEQATQRANAFFDAVLTAIPDYTFVTDLATGNVIYGSPAKDLLGLSAAELDALGRSGIAELTHPEDRERLRALRVAAMDLADGQVLQTQYRARRVDGQWRWLSHRTTPFRRDRSGRVVETLAVVRDITDVVDAEERLVRAARHDYLTGLPNRALLVERLEAALSRTEAGGEVAVLFVDLDGFKSVNDTGGHAAGDSVLIEVARRLGTVIREGDTVARVGGDEFVIVIEPWNRTVLRPGLAADRAPAPSVRALAVQVADRVSAALGEPVLVHGLDFAVTASIGVTYAGPRHRETADSLLHQADTAMYRAKGRGKNRYEVAEAVRLTPAPR